MATSKSQRIGIWVIAVVLTVGTIGSFFVAILANNNNQSDQKMTQSQREKLQKIFEEYQAKVKAQSDELSNKYYPTFSQYSGRVGAFNADDVKSVSHEDLLAGDGEEIKDGTKYSAYYIGWNPEGKIFDQSIEGGKLKMPIQGQGLIEGWTEGVKGMKLGGVRLITINADKAYGDKGSGDLIPPHTPIKFVVMAIPNPEQIPIPAELQSLQ